MSFAEDVNVRNIPLHLIVINIERLFRAVEVTAVNIRLRLTVKLMSGDCLHQRNKHMPTTFGSLSLAEEIPEKFGFV